MRTCQTSENMHMYETFDRPTLHGLAKTFSTSVGAAQEVRGERGERGERNPHTTPTTAHTQLRKACRTPGTLSTLPWVEANIARARGDVKSRAPPETPQNQRSARRDYEARRRGLDLYALDRCASRLTISASHSRDTPRAVRT